MNNIPTPALALYKALAGKSDNPLDPDSALYVSLLGSTPSKDPILRLFERIRSAESESVNLLTGFRGNGKSTQLRRLRKLLTDAGSTVFLIDMQDYVLFTKPIELADFMLSLSAALGDAVRDQAGLDVVSKSIFRRLWTFLKGTDVEIDSLDFGSDSARLSMKLKTEADFKKKVQDRLKVHVARLVQEVAVFASEIVDAIRKRLTEPDRKVVLLVDSLEQIRGVGEGGDAVLSSIVELFAGETSRLAIPKLHVVYTVPPYLATMAPNFGRIFGGPVTTWPNIHVRKRDGAPDREGLDVVQKVIAKRCREWESVLTPAQLDRLASATGGDLRDLFRLVREAALTLELEMREDPMAKITDATLNAAEQELRNDLTPHATNDVVRLAQIARTKSATLPDVTDVKTLARFFDSNWIMNYLNGEPWFDVHPLVVQAIERQRDNAGPPQKT